MKVKAVVKLIKADGWSFERSGRGDHRIYKHPSKPGIVVIDGKGSDDTAVFIDNERNDRRYHPLMCVLDDFPFADLGSNQMIPAICPKARSTRFLRWRGSNEVAASSQANLERSSVKYPYVIEKAPANYAAFFPDVPGVATAKTKAELHEHMAEVLALTLLDYADRAETLPVPTPLGALELSEYEPEEPFEIAEVEPASINPVSLEIERALEASGVSRAELARRMGVSRSVVSRLVNPFYFGHSLSSLRRVAEALGKTLEVEFKGAA